MNTKADCCNCGIEIDSFQSRLSEDGYPICDKCFAENHGLTEEQLKDIYK